MVESWEEERGGTAAGGAGAGPSSLAAGRDGGAALAGGCRGGSACAAKNPQRQQQRRVIRWERFLPRRSLRVLLVEPDDCTRHIVTALLRKCSYNVVSAADGLKAWDVLKERNYSFDLVLSEVEIPSLTGISLLSKIMANGLTKNIPVIMMSSRDSVSIVFRCMHKGAVDFLVKPVRINELRNLWQHVWRRHCSTNFTNGPETVANNQTVSENMSDNGTSNDVSANMGKGSNNNESDGGDDQSSCSKLPMENVRPEHQGPIMDRDSTKVIKSQAQHINDSISTSDDALSNHADNEMKGKSRGVTVSSVKETPMSDKVQERVLDAKSLSTGKGLDPIREVCVDASHSSSLQKVVCKSPEGLIDFIGSDVKGQCSFSAIDNHREREAGMFGSRRSSSRINTFTADPSPSWELSLKRPLNGCLKNGFHEKNVLNHSPASAFSRYANSGICMQVQKSDYSLANLYMSGGGSADVCRPQLDSPGTLIERPIPFIPNGRSLYFQRNKEFMVYHQISSSNDEDTESLASAQKEETLTGCRGSKTHPGFPHSHFGAMSLSMPAGATPFQGFSSGSNYGPILQPVFYNDSSASPHGSTSVKQGKCLSSDQPANDCNHVNSDFLSTEVGSYEEDYDPRLSELRATESTVNIAQEDPRFRLHICGNEERAEQRIRYNLEIINSDGRKENGRTAEAFVTTNSTFGLRSSNGALSYGGKGVDQPRSHREAALIKFRMKRKDRCFEKKVRYHSRKMLAEQRPRVKGQFVRQTVADPAGTASDVDY